MKAPALRGELIVFFHLITPVHHLRLHLRGGGVGQLVAATLKLKAKLECSSS
jgi:hypothetical protein